MTSSSQALIQVEKLSVSIGSHHILNHVSTQFQRSQFTVLLGPNGTGKSTLLKAISNEIPHQGKCVVLDKDIKHWQRNRLAQHFGVLPQASSLTFNFNVQEVVELGGMSLKLSQAQLEQVVWRNMQQTHVEHLAQRLYPTLSGGEKQRVHLARVLTQIEQAGEDKILFLDEPTSALDLSHQHHTLKLAQQMAQQGACVIAVLHDLNLAAQYADRLVILNQGQIVADGTPWQVLTEDKIAEVYQWHTSVISHPSQQHPVVLSAN